ncbi:MAG: LysR family transcriptional regulator [Eubacterium sp.]|nr:LysR family transcriptional regulator [Eubacterium sp.]
MDKYNFRSIGYFLRVADTLNFTQAADELYITQPALSKCIKQLEEEVGVSLFNRSTKKVELTEGGKLLYNEWKIWHNRSEELLHEARMLNGIGATKIKIGIVEFGGVVNKVMPVIEDYDDAHPEFEVDFEILGFSDLARKLKSGELDFIITLNTEIDANSKSIHVRNLMGLQLYIIVPQKNHFYNNDTLTFKDLKDETFCVFTDNYSDEARSSIITHCKSEGFIPKDIKFFSNMRSLEMTIAHSEYITIGYDTFFDSNAKMKLFPIEDAIGDHGLVFAWKGELKKTTTELFNYLQKVFENQKA